MSLGLKLLTQNNLEKIWVTTLNARGLVIPSGKVYSLVRAVGEPLADAVVVLGRALKMTADEYGCLPGNF